MDPYATLGVPRGCTRQQAKEAFRTLVHRAHPDRGGDGEAFVRLCAAYREVLGELERTATPKPPRPPDPREGRADYVAWLRQVSAESGRRRPSPWWRRNPAKARAWLLILIGLGGVLVLVAALALSLRSPGGRGGGAPRRLNRTAPSAAVRY